MKKLFKRKTVAAVRFLAVVMVLISIALSEMPAYAAETEMGDAFYGNTVIGINAGTSFAAKANTTSKKPGSKKAFLADPRYDHNSPWGYSKRPIYSPASGIGCYAYAADYAKCVYKKNSPTAGKKFTKASQIRSGDIVKVVNSQHWIVILERNGNKLKTAEGDLCGKVRISSKAYTIRNGRLCHNGKPFRTFSVGYHFK